MDTILSSEFRGAQTIVDCAAGLTFQGVLDVAHAYRHLPGDERRSSFLMVMETIERRDLHDAREQIVRRAEHATESIKWTTGHLPQFEDGLANAFAEAVISAALACLVRDQISAEHFEVLYRPFARFFPVETIEA